MKKTYTGKNQLSALQNPFENFSYQEVNNKIESFIKKEVHSAGFNRVIVALSGGIDSTVSTYLCVSALGADNVYALLLPFGNLHPQGLVDSLSVAGKLKIPRKNVFTVDIKSICQSFYKKIDVSEKLRQGNIMARVRMTILFDMAKKHQALVVGTENKSEHLLGYFTRFGDEASDIEPIRSLYKSQVRLLAKFLKVPPNIISKTPSANLWTGQTDEGEMGITYRDADMILYHVFEKGKSWEDLTSGGFDKDVVRKVNFWVSKNQFKHHLPKVIPSF